MSVAARSNVRMNSRPMILRFCSGSLTPSSAPRNSPAALTTLSRTPVAATKSFSTCSASPLRSSPWSTNTQCSRSPMARWTRAAATAESTPAGRPAHGDAVADLGPDLLDLLVDDARGGPARLAAGRVQEALQHGLAVVGVHDLGVELHAEQLAVTVLDGRDRRGPGRGGDLKSGRGRDTGVPVGHPHPLPGGQPGQQAAQVREGVEGG